MEILYFYRSTVQAKMSSQTFALTKVAASTWGDTLNQARQVYTAVACPAMTKGTALWHSPKGTRTKGLGTAAKLATLQNKCLRSTTGAYRATNIKVLEAESGVILWISTSTKQWWEKELSKDVMKSFV